MLEFVDAEFLTQILSQTTRGGAILDLIFTNTVNRRELEVVENIILSDHNSVRMGITIAKPTDADKTAESDPGNCRISPHIIGI